MSCYETRVVPYRDETGRCQDWGKSSKMPKVARLKHPLNFEPSSVLLKAYAPEEGLFRFKAASSASLLVVRVGTFLEDPSPQQGRRTAVDWISIGDSV